MRKIKNIGVLTAAALICVCIAGGSVLAQEGEYNRSSCITSKGAVKYAGGKVVIDSSDLTYLTDEIDDLERAYKSKTVEALNKIGTFYVSAEGEISHEPGDNNVSPDTAPVLSFDDLYRGIKESQSVGYLACVQATDEYDNPLYYADESAAGRGDLITVTADANDFPLLIRPAVADNLTAGTAAWVDGKALIGTGADNRAYYSEGYDKGYDEGYGRGYDEGYDEGYNEGYGKGYDTGRNDAIPVDSLTFTLALIGANNNPSHAEIPIAGAKEVKVHISQQASYNWEKDAKAVINGIELEVPDTAGTAERTWTKQEIGNATILYLIGKTGLNETSVEYTNFTVTVYY